MNSTTRRLAFAAISTVVLLCAGCHEEAPANGATPLEPADRFGLITVSYAEHRVPGGARPQVHATGVFARHTGIDRASVLALLNHPDSPDSQVLDMPIGQCRTLDRPLGRAVEHEDAWIELLDAGEIRLELGHRAGRLRRRSVPEVFESVAGVTYEGSLLGATPLSGGALRVDGRGSDDVGDFYVDLEVPPVPRLLSVDGRPVTSAWGDIRWDADVEVRWLAAEPAADGAAVVFIELAVLHFDRTLSLVCAAPDSGEFVIPQEQVAALAPMATPDATVRLITRRIARETFATAGIHGGEALFVSRDSLLLE